MKYKFLFFIYSFFVLFFCLETKASSSDSDSHNKKEFNVVDMIMHHITDSHEWHLYGEKKSDISISLPVFLWTSNDGLIFFMSKEFKHDNDGKIIVTKKGLNFVRFHENIYKLKSGEKSLKFDSSSHYALNASKPIDFSITKEVFSMILCVFLILIIFIPISKAYKNNLIPTGKMRGLMEPLIIFIRDDIAKSLIGSKYYLKFTPYLLSLFFFLWFNNLLGLIPIGVNLTGNIAFTLVMAVFTFFIVNISGNKHYWKHIFWMPGVPIPMKIFLAPIEILGVFTKPFALMIRLFANITAGHIIILGLISLIFVFGWAGTPSLLLATPLMILEFAVAFIQAYIFTFLTALFISNAVQDDEHH